MKYFNAKIEKNCKLTSFAVWQTAFSTQTLSNTKKEIVLNHRSIVNELIRVEFRNRVLFE